MDIKRLGSQSSAKGPDDWFTGTVQIAPLVTADDPARASGGSVTFNSVARTARHTHPLGQTRIVTAGLDRVQREGGPIAEIRPGDVVWFPPGEKHWHGSSPTIAMTHITIQERLRRQGGRLAGESSMAARPVALAAMRASGDHRVPTARTGMCLAFALGLCALVGSGLTDGARAQQVGADSSQRTETMKIRITVEGKAVTGTLDDNPTSRAFVSLLPLTLTLSDYGTTEKVSDLPRKLATDGAPVGFKPSVGDIAYYAPWGNLAIFRESFRYSSGLIRLGSIDTGGEALNRSGPLRAVIAPAGE